LSKNAHLDAGGPNIDIDLDIAHNAKHADDDEDSERFADYYVQSKDRGFISSGIDPKLIK